ncbi:MAG: TonB-dependent receptor domain-containing protein [Bryobacteraceae bacterium]
MKTRMGWWRLVVLPLAAFPLWAQGPAVQIKGTVCDQSGAAIPGATITVTGQGAAKTFSTNEVGAYTVTGLPPGKYSVRLSAFGFSSVVKPDIEIQPGKALLLDANLPLAVEKQEVTVEADSNRVSTEASSNVGAIVLREADLDALSDDPDDLESDLQALAGPSAGPNGGQIFIDGFSNGKLPPKSSIREVRINQNPFSSEYDRLGFGRIEVFTKPGSDTFHGQAFISDSNNAFNARNPFSDTKPEFDARYYGGNVSGPLSKKASFFLDVERRQIQDDALIYGTDLDTNLNPIPVNQTLATPQWLTIVSPRLDYQLTPKNTLVVRYTYNQNDKDNAGVGGFALPSEAYNTTLGSQNVQITETAMVSAHAVNETRLQFFRTQLDNYGNNTVPTLAVSDSFSDGGSQIGRAWNSDDHWELQNYTSWTEGRHSLKAGARFRYSDQSDESPTNFGGSFTFNGGPAPELDSSNQPILDPSGNPVMKPITSLQRYAETLYLQQQGFTAAQISQLGYGASMFSIVAGTPLATVTQADLGAFIQDDWRVKTNFTLSLGLRYENQSNIHDGRDFAPRIGFAWAPGAKKGVQKTVIRGGSGVFYSRIDDTYTLQSLHYNGTNEQEYIVINPDFFPNVPSISQLAAQAQTVWMKDPNLRAPYILQSAVSLERQLPRNTTAALTFTDSVGNRLLRSTILTETEGPLLGDRVYEYQSNGILRQNQLIANINSRFNKSISITSFYVFNHANSNTDSAYMFPANPSDLSAEYGRAAIDVRHRFMMFGSLAMKHNIRLSPFIMAASGAPFNITLGQDLFGDGLLTARPSFATAPGPGVVSTPWGMFNLNPAPGAAMIPRNYGQGPGNFSVNFRLSKTFGFGPVKGEAAAATPGAGQGPGGGRGPGGIMMPVGRGPGGPGGMGGRGGMFGGDTTDHRFNLTLSASARNILNHVNPGPPNGDLASPLFGESVGLGSMGPGGSTANNRRLELQLRLSF